MTLKLSPAKIVKRNYDGVYLRCLEKEDANKVLSELHDGPAWRTFQR
jgi:hypothetical protein